MIAAAAGLVIGGVLARFGLWPFEMELERRRVASVHARAARLADDIARSNP